MSVTLYFVIKVPLFARDMDILFDRWHVVNCRLFSSSDNKHDMGRRQYYPTPTKV